MAEASPELMLPPTVFALALLPPVEELIVRAFPVVEFCVRSALLVLPESAVEVLLELAPVSELAEERLVLGPVGPVGPVGSVGPVTEVGPVGSVGPVG